MLRFVGIKIPLDGGVEGARMYSPFRIVPGEQPDAAYRGVPLLPPGGEDEYVDGLKLIAEAGLQVQTHAVGDETIDVIVRAYERVNRDKPIRDLRWTIMHIFHPSDAAIKKMAELGILATVQDRGSIETGKLADLAVLSHDILAVDPDAIVRTKALMTVVGGKIVHRSGL
jgi:predicted amidohydrolase YtcJ